jgi:hypothetical protein
VNYRYFLKTIGCVRYEDLLRDGDEDDEELADEVVYQLANNFIIIPLTHLY